MSRKRSSKKPRTSSTLQQHQRVGKLLNPPLAQLPVQPTAYIRDALPELLWIDSFLSEHGLARSASIFHKFMDILDQFVPEDSKKVLTGMVSSFSLIPEERRRDALEAIHSSGLDP